MKVKTTVRLGGKTEANEDEDRKKMKRGMTEEDHKMGGEIDKGG